MAPGYKRENGPQLLVPSGITKGKIYFSKMVLFLVKTIAHKFQKCKNDFV
jgi:hypothetical protein